MERFKVSNNFYLDEFVTPALWKKHGPGAIKFVDERLITLAQTMREMTGVWCYINTWWNGGKFTLRGVRPPESTLGAKLSQHKYVIDPNGILIRKCQAIDITFGTMSGKEMHDFVRANAKKLFDLGLRRIEDYSISTSWLHADLKHTGLENGIQVVDLTKVTDVIHF